MERLDGGYVATERDAFDALLERIVDDVSNHEPTTSGEVARRLRADRMVVAGTLVQARKWGFVTRTGHGRAVRWWLG